ncbi:MAG: hypothetical protein MJ134_04415 [Lachnospiraceae bacterium]|nr:hypothetical protein [Lachnospiraceae bacterium]
MSGEHRTHGKRARRNSTSPVTVILAVLLVIALGVIAWLLIGGGNTKPPDNPQPEQTEPVEKLTDSIDIPGFGELHFKAGQTEQNMTVPNPPQNFCWFKVSLVLEDGTVLWTSDFIAPGEQSDKVVLNEPLEKGEYKNAMLKYQCFADEAGQQALNGAETKLTIIVK